MKIKFLSCIFLLTGCVNIPIRQDVWFRKEYTFNNIKSLNCILESMFFAEPGLEFRNRSDEQNQIFDFRPATQHSILKPIRRSRLRGSVELSTEANKSLVRIEGYSAEEGYFLYSDNDYEKTLEKIKQKIDQMCTSALSQ